jgi:hypothetical protein
MIFATAAAYAAGIATMLVLSARRSALARPIPPAWLPQTVKVEPPPKPPPPRLPIAPTLPSPFAPKSKTKPKPRVAHWPAKNSRFADAFAEATVGLEKISGFALNDSGPPQPIEKFKPSTSFLPVMKWR